MFKINNNNKYETIINQTFLCQSGKFTPEVNAEKVALGGLAETPVYISPHLFNSQSATRGQQEEGEEGDEGGGGGRGNNVNKKFTSAANQQTSSIPFDFSTPNVTGSVVITPPSITHETGDDGGGRKASFIPNTKMVAVLPSSDHIAVVGGGADYVISTPNNTANSTGMPVMFATCMYVCVCIIIIYFLASCQGEFFFCLYIFLVCVYVCRYIQSH